MRVFADTHFYVALLSRHDAAHAAASRWLRDPTLDEIITTSWVLVELANCMSRQHEREVTAQFIDSVRRAPETFVIPADEQLLARGFDLYRSRPDKQWSLTDCISFVVMRERGLTKALTGDHHFEQAGFTVLLK